MSNRLVVPILALICLAAPTTAAAKDRDHDGLPDRWERQYHLSTSARSTFGDPDHDRLSNRREFRLHTNPRRADTDRDGLRDRAEVVRWHTNPRKRDTDGDGYSDGREVRAHTNPRNRRSHPGSPSARTTPSSPTEPGPPTIPSLPLAGPTARFSFSPANPHAGQQVTFDAGGSTCVVAPCTYSWQDVGPEGADSWALGSGPTLRFTFSGAGTKYVQLRVTDALGQSDSIERDVSVSAAPAPTPTPSPTPTPAPSPTPPPTPGACDRSATPSTFASQVSAASAGQSICLASGSYGTWSGTNKQVTIRAATGATPTMKIEFDTGDSGFTLDGIGGLGGDMLNGSSNITIRNSTFTSTLNIDGNANNQPRNIVLDHNQHTFAGQMGSGDLNGKIRIRNNAGSFTGVTVENSTFANGDWDGIHLGGGANIINNTFSDLCDTGGNHTDNIQFEGGAGGDIRGNYIHSTCTTQGITSYDGATNGVTIEDNVIDIRRAWGIEFYSDKNSIIRHNTIRYYAPGCYANSPCGYISLDRKTQDPAGTGTQVYDNIAMITIDDGSTAARNDHNLNNNQVTYTGPTTTYNGYKLNPNSPGHNAADDGQDDGARIG